MDVITTKGAWELLAANNDAVLVDVRRNEEWQAGCPDISSLGNKILFVTISADAKGFAEELKKNVQNPATNMLFLCYSGVRSKAAAEIAERLGYVNCYNVSGGFLEWSNLGLPSTKMGVR